MFLLTFLLLQSNESYQLKQDYIELLIELMFEILNTDKNRIGYRATFVMNKARNSQDYLKVRNDVINYFSDNLSILLTNLTQITDSEGYMMKLID